MDIHASMLDQMLEGEISRHADLLPYADIERRKALAFVVFCMAKRLKLSFEEASEYLMDGGNDAGIDGLYVQDADGDEIHITLFQAKYARNFDADQTFPENAILKTISTIKEIFDPARELSVHQRLKPRLEEIRSLIRDGHLDHFGISSCIRRMRSWMSQKSVRFCPRIQAQAFCTHEALPQAI